MPLRSALGLALVLFSAATASAAPISLRFTETQMPLGTTSSVVPLTGNEYLAFNILVDDLYRYHDARDPFSDGAENQGGTNPYGVAVCLSGHAGCAASPLGQIDFINSVSNLSIDWWTIGAGRTIFIDVYNSANALIGSFSGTGSGTYVLNLADISRFTFHDSGGFVLVSNIRFDSAAVPEPATLALLGVGAMIATARRLRRRTSETR